MALHSYAAASDSRVPGINGSIFLAILPHLDGGAAYDEQWRTNPSSRIDVRVYVSPADPSLLLGQLGAPDGDPPGNRSSYPANATAFAGSPRLPHSFPDGTSNTIALAEHYTMCRDTVYLYPIGVNMAPQVRRSAFADRGKIPTPFGEFAVQDVIPVTTGSPPLTRASTPGLTFQVRPKVENCNPLIPQTPHQGGMLVAMVDGSVQKVRPEVAETVFWAAVTPAGGEVASLD